MNRLKIFFKNFKKYIEKKENNIINITANSFGFNSMFDYQYFIKTTDEISVPGWWQSKTQAISSLMPAYKRAADYVLLNQLDGDFAEFGSYSGFTATHFAYLLYQYNSQKTFWAFDSFIGLPKINTKIDKNSPEVSELKVWGEGAMSTEKNYEKKIESLLRKYLPQNQIKVTKGFFSEILKPENLPKKISLLHLDCDLYSSTKEVLKFLLKQKIISSGAVILFDDFNCGRASNSFGQRRALIDIQRKFKDIKFEPWFSYGWHGQSYFVQ